MLNGTTQSVPISSAPSGAEVTLISTVPGGAEVSLNDTRVMTLSLNHTKVTTPALVELQRGQTYAVVISHKGYKSQTTALVSNFSSYMWLDLGSLCLICLAVDLATGGCCDLEPSEINITLEPEPN
jgi:hypothetical protein